MCNTSHLLYVMNARHLHYVLFVGETFELSVSRSHKSRFQEIKRKKTVKSSECRLSKIKHVVKCMLNQVILKNDAISGKHMSYVGFRVRACNIVFVV